MTNLEMRLLAASLDMKDVRLRCDVSLSRIGRALGVWPSVVQRWEIGVNTPQGRLGERYLRIILGLRNHLEVPLGDVHRPVWAETGQAA